jgi:hypothetical protein
MKQDEKEEKRKWNTDSSRENDFTALIVISAFSLPNKTLPPLHHSLGSE